MTTNTKTVTEKTIAVIDPMSNCGYKNVQVWHELESDYFELSFIVKGRGQDSNVYLPKAILPELIAALENIVASDNESKDKPLDEALQITKDILSCSTFDQR